MGNAIISRRERLELKRVTQNYDFEEKLLPEELKNCATKYTCFLPNGDVLISGYGEDIGIWHFEKETLSFYKLYNEGYWSTFQLLANGELISSEIDVLSVNFANYSLGSYMGGTVNGDYIFAETKVQKISDGSVCNLNDTYSASYFSKYNIAVGSKFIVYKN